MFIVALIIVFVFGAVFGSFACCQAQRLHWRNHCLKNKTVSHRKKTQAQHKYTSKNVSLGRYSVCFHCGHKIAWYDNIPIISWLVLKGKCRHCHKKIGVAEFLAEIGMGLAFVGVSWQYFAGIFGTISTQDCIAPFCASPTSGLPFVLTTIVMIVLAIMLVVLGILAVYDGKWGELPQFLLTISIICGIIIGVIGSCIKIINHADIASTLINLLAGVALLAGLYFLFYKLSRERWMGGGDWLLALGIAFAVGNWWLALWVLFLSNLIGSLVMMPFAVKRRDHAVHFGPFLVLGFCLVIALSPWLSSFLVIF